MTAKILKANSPIFQFYSPNSTLEESPSSIRNQREHQTKNIPTPRSTQNNMNRKAAPPVPKKPINLTHPAEDLENARMVVLSDEPHETWTQSSRPSSSQSQRADPSNTQGSHQAGSLKYLHRQATSKNSFRKQANAGNGHVSSPDPYRPSLPPRPQIDLMDQDEDGANNIPSLEPLRF